jgi:hypothetical protein
MKKHILALLSMLCSTVAMAQYIGTFLNTGGGSGPTGITRDDSGNFYVMLRGQQKVIKIDPQLNVTDYCTSGLPLYAMGLALDDQGNLYVAGYTSNSVLQIPPGGGPAVPYATGIAEPVDIKQYDGDTLVVRGSSAVYKIHPGGGVAGSAAVPQLFTHSDGLYGGLFVYANKDFGLINSQLQRVDKNTFAFTNVGAVPVVSGYPVLLSNRFGNDQFYMPMGGTLYRVDGATGAYQAVPSSYSFGEAYGAHADEEANYWVTEFTFGRISTYLEDCTSSTVLTVSACEQYEFGGNTLTQSGTYTNTLTNIYNCDSVVTLELTINSLPEINAVVNDYSPCSGQSLVLSATGANIFQWDNGLGSGAQHNITATQSVTYTAYGIDGNGCQGSDTVAITVTPNPTIGVDASPNEICLGELVDLSATGADEFLWDNGIGAGASHALNPQETTTYTVTGSTNGCQTTASVLVTVNPIPEVEATASPNEICLGELVDLSAIGADEFFWDNGLGAGEVHTLNPQETTTYTVTGTTNGCQASASVTVTVNPLPEILAQSDDLIICVGESTLLEASANVAVDWLWMGGISSDPTVSVAPTETTTYTVFGTDGNGCVGFDEITVEVNTCVGINDGTNPDHMHVWVDGADNSLRYTDMPTPAVLLITDMMGREVWTTNLTTTSGQLMLQVPAGTYAVQVVSGVNRIAQKLMVGR